MELQKYLTSGQTVISNLLLQKYHQVGMTNEELLVYLQLQMYQGPEKVFPDLEKVSSNLQISLDIIYQILDSLSQKNFISLETQMTEDGKKSDYYNLYPIFEQIDNLERKSLIDNDNPLRLLLVNLEKLLGRVLSPLEIEQAHNWLEQDQFTADLIELAFKEAIINNVNAPFKYVNSILRNWQSKQITTIEEASQEIYKHRSQAYKQSPMRAKVPINHSKE